MHTPTDGFLSSIQRLLSTLPDNLLSRYIRLVKELIRSLADNMNLGPEASCGNLVKDRL